MPTIGDCPKCEKRSFIIEDKGARISPRFKGKCYICGYMKDINI